MNKTRLAKTLIPVILLVILSVSSPVLTADKEKTSEQKNLSLFDSNTTFFLCKINTTGNASVKGSLSTFPGVGGEMKLFGATVLIDIEYDDIESHGNTTIKPFFGLSSKEIHLNGSHHLNIWCLWGDVTVPPLGMVGPAHIDGTALFVKVL